MSIGFPHTPEEQAEYVRKNRHFFVEYAPGILYTEKVKAFLYEIGFVKKDGASWPASIFKTSSNQFLKLIHNNELAKEYKEVQGWVELDFFVARMSADGVMITITLKPPVEIVSRQTISAVPRQLKAGWTIQQSEDIQTEFGLEIENDIAKILSEEITKEIDNEILLDILKDTWFI